MGFFRIFMLPLALLYGIVVWLRNALFDIGVLPSRQYDIPVISVGNLRTGGTGKTPHVEYLIRLLKEKHNIAVLSRGYKRKTKGFVVAGRETSCREIGDEPGQIYNKFPDLVVAVHEKRCKGIKKILEKYPKTDLIILDDAFQHRYVKPGLNLLFTGYYNPFFDDFLLPVGHLREGKRRAKRSDALIVTKTPAVFSPLDRRYFLKKLEKYHQKPVFFSTFAYKQLKPFNRIAEKTCSMNLKSIFLLTGIANTVALEEYLKTKCQDLHLHKYKDHHQFTGSDLKKLRMHVEKTISYSKVIVTTEKDAMRLQDTRLQENLEDIPVFVLPVEVHFHGPDQAAFNDMVFRFLKQHKKTGNKSMSPA